MALQQKGMHGTWTSRWTFIMAATGSAVGLGNMWKFPYVAGSNGGGAFVLIYLGCILLIGVPVMMSEVLIGRNGRQSPINSMNEAVADSNANSLWRCVGWLGVLAGLLILSFYAVIAGWAMDYIFLISSGELQGVNGESAAAAFNSLLSDPSRLIFWQTIFMGLCVAVVVGGVKKGLGIAVETLMPILFIMLLMLLGFAVIEGNFSAAVNFLFSFNLEALTWRGVLEAMGQAFFTLSLGMGAIMTYGAYMPKDASILSSATSIALIDTSMALLSGLVIFPLVFANGLESSAGPGLMFVTIPIAFGSMSGGTFFGVMFFVLVSFAAITSAISLVEPALAWVVEKLNTSRRNGAIVVCTIAWALGLGSAFSTNIGSELYLLPGMTFFDSMDYVSNNIMLPLGGMLIALFTGWFLSQDIVARQLQISGGKLIMFKVLVRFVAPIGVGLVFINRFI